VTRCRGKLIAKFCFAKGFLVRTHFGDMFNHLSRNMNSSEKDDLIQRVLADVGDIAKHKIKRKLYPLGVICFQDMKDHGDAVNVAMPKNMSNKAQLFRFARKFIAAYSKKKITSWAKANRRYKQRLTVGKWILAFRKGKDLMSDRDSRMTKGGKIHIFKSMGGRRILPGSRVLIEVRRTRYNQMPNVRCSQTGAYFKHVAQSILKRASAEDEN